MKKYNLALPFDPFLTHTRKSPLMNTITRQLKTIFVTLLTLLSLNTQAGTIDIAQALDSMSSFEADFVQTVSDEKLFREEKSSGKVWIQRPGKFFWRYDSGNKMDIVADGINLWIYQPELKQVMVQSLQEIGDDLPISWLASGQPVKQRYNTRQLPEKADGLTWFDLQNKKGGSQEIAFIELGMKGNVMQKVRLTSSDGRVTLVQFQQPKRDHRIAEERFIFQPEAGIDIVGSPE
jgi:outer membrane lipoprotein carrier protein